MSLLEKIAQLTTNCTAAIVVVIQETRNIKATEEDAEEISSLLTTLGILTKDIVIQKKQRLSSGHLLGSGKIEEIKKLAVEKKANLIVIDHPVTGPQARNIKEMTDCTVIDRAGVILDIFAKHAKTNAAKIQVEIAQLEYLLPRLAGAWSHFQRQKGGGVQARGMGEQQIEVDRRRARERISRLHRRLEKITKERITQRKSRENELKVAIVGYTNSGKTSLMKVLTRATITGKDELFATLDARVRVLDPRTRPKILLSDTVGFIKKLPHSLVESFKSTLEEVVHAELLLHVVDISHSDYLSQMKITQDVLQEIGAGEIPSILVFNKIDKVNEPFLTRILQKKYPHSIVVSAFSPDHVMQLREHIFKYFQEQFSRSLIRVRSDQQHLLSYIYRNCVVLKVKYDKEGGLTLDVRAPQSCLARLSKHLI